jgi:hypothetical protein
MGLGVHCETLEPRVSRKNVQLAMEPAMSFFGHSRFWSGLALLMAATACFAQDPLPATAENLAEFRSQADEIRAAMGAGGVYANLPADTRKRVNEQLSALEGIYTKRGDKPATQRQEVQIINATSEINALLTGREEERVICEQVKRIGSNRHDRVCQTVAQREANRKSSKAAMHEIRPAGRSGNN